MTVYTLYFTMHFSTSFSQLLYFTFHEKFLVPHIFSNPSKKKRKEKEEKKETDMKKIVQKLLFLKLSTRIPSKTIVENIILSLNFGPFFFSFPTSKIQVIQGIYLEYSIKILDSIDSTIPIKKDDREGKYKKKKNKKGPAATIPLNSLGQLFVTKLYILCSFNRL